MPLYIKEDATAALVTKLAKQRGVTKQDTVRQAAQSELDCIEQAVPLRERLGTFRRASKFIWFALADWLRRRNNGRGSGQTQVDRAQRKPARPPGTTR
jgi:antitoxin VapB